MKYVVRPIVVVALVAAAWGQVPAANAEKGGNNPTTKQGSGGTIGAHITRDDRYQVFSNTETDLATGEVLVHRVVSEYDNHGLLVHELKTDTDNGVLTDSEEASLTYDQANRLSRVVIVTDPDGAGALPPSTRVDTLTRDAQHDLTSIVTTVDDDSDGLVDSTSTESQGFDQRGRAISTRVEDGGRVTTTSYTYDSHGDILDQTIDTDDLSTPQSPDTSSTFTSSYTQPHNLVSEQSDQLLAYDAQGNARSLGSETTTFTRTNKGSISGSVETADLDGDGQIDVTSVSTGTFDNQENLLSESSRTVEGGDVYTSSQVFTNDKSGRPVREVSEDRLNGALIDRRVEVDTLDKFGRLVKAVTSVDSDGDGSVDSVETYLASYDNKSRPVLTDDSYTDGNGALLSRDTRTTTYGKVSYTETDRIDSDGDGVVDHTTVTVVPL